MKEHKSFRALCNEALAKDPQGQANFARTVNSLNALGAVVRQMDETRKSVHNPVPLTWGIPKLPDPLAYPKFVAHTLNNVYRQGAKDSRHAPFFLLRLFRRF